MTVFCSMLVFAVAFGQAALPASADAPTLTMGQVDTGTSTASGGSSARVADQHVRETAPAVTAATVNPNFVNINLEGCRNTGSITLPINGKFVCPDAAYTSGNLGKGWNELDLVPHRAIMTSGTQTGTTTDYDFNIVADGEDAGRPGYDLLTVPEVNAAKSDASCTVSSSDQGSKIPGIGGTHMSIYRTVHIHQNKGTTCVIDWAERLALGSHLYPGSSLHSNLTQADFTTGGIGAEDVSIPVKEIKPQELSKTETATQGAGNVWRVSKTATPSSLTFDQTCNPDNPTTHGVQIDVTVTKSVQTTGNTVVHAEITATNPAHRIVDVTISDSIFEGAIGSSTLATALSGQNPKTFPLTSIPAESSITLVHEIEVANGAANVYSDKATAKYTDHAYPDVNIPGQTEATAQATVQTNTSSANSSVTVTDLESISGNSDVEYRIDAGSAAGTYTYNDGAKETYTPGTTGFTRRPILWTSGSVSATTTFTFLKTVGVSQPTSGDATLADTAKVIGDGAEVLGTASASVDISSTLDCPDVVVTKTPVEGTINAGETAAFEIVVTNNGPGVAKNVTLTDTLPDGITWTEDSDSCSIANGVLSCAFGDLPAGASRTVHVSGTTDAADCGVLHNTATVAASNEPQTNQGNNSDDADITVNCPGISVTKTPDDASVDAADQVGFLITVANAGPGVAKDVHLDDPLPTNDGLDWSIDGGTGDQFCDITQGSLVCDFGNMDAGASYTVHITSDTNHTTCGVIDNTATVTISNGDGDSASASITVTCPDIGIDLVKDGPAMVHVGDTITYDFTVQLLTPEPLFDVTLTDDTGVCDADPVFVSGDDGDAVLEPGEVWTYTCDHVVTEDDPFVVAAADGSNVIVNTATVVGTADDGRTTQDTDDHTVTVINPAIDIVKEVNPQSGNPGDIVTYTYAVTNTGDTTLYNVSVDDDVIGHIGDIAELAPGETVTLTKDWELPSGVIGTVTNVGTATGTDVLGKTVTADDDADVVIVEATHHHKPPTPPTAFTGSDALRLGLLTLALLGLGLLALVASRRRRGHSA
jgi:uncharacterized repeat protein (TIGR01451 family)